MILRKSLIHPNSFALELDDGEAVNNKMLDGALCLVNSPQQEIDIEDEPVANALEHVEPLVAPLLYGQADPALADNNVDENVLIAPAMNFDKPKEKKNDSKTKGTVRNNEGFEPLVAPVMNFGKR